MMLNTHVSVLGSSELNVVLDGSLTTLKSR